MLDLEDAVPPDLRPSARIAVAETLRRERAWVRINLAGTPDGDADLIAIGDLAAGVRMAKVESPPEQVEWVVARLTAGIPIIAAIESARGLEAVGEIAAVPDLAGLSIGGGLDLANDLGVDSTSMTLDHARARIVIASADRRLRAPIDSVHPDLSDPEGGLRHSTERARLIGFGSKSAIHPAQVPTINAVFAPDAGRIAWAERVLRAWERSSGSPTTTDAGEFVDPPVVDRARSILGGMLARRPPTSDVVADPLARDRLRRAATR